jgi:aryl-alcohol dehydrogenase-like predicted oxidoreductase
MRDVEFAPLARRVSAIGFGCASLGSRVDARRGTTALARAYDAGVSWFDVAPSYGNGHAENLLGKFLVGKRSQVAVCTKVGLLPGRERLASRVITPILRSAIRWFPGLRKQVVKRRPPAQRVALTGPLVESSIVESLRRLHTDCVDVLALHEAHVADVQRDDVLQALDNVVRKGYARTIGWAGDLGAGLAAISLSEHFGVLQVSNDELANNITSLNRQLPAGRSVRFVTHSVYGHEGSLDVLTSKIAKQPDTRMLMNSMGYRDAPRKAAAAYLLDFALASNRQGVVLLSMYEPEHLSFNIGRLEASPPPEIVLDLANHLRTPHACQDLLGDRA